MPYVPHGRVVARFSLGDAGNKTETASCSLSFSPGLALTTSAGRQAMANDCFDDWAAWVTRSASKVVAAVTLEDVRVYNIDTEGHAVDDTVISEGTPVSGTTTQDRHPWQCSTVLTLEAGTRGQGRFGRIFLPPQGIEIKSDGLMDPSASAAAWGSAQTLLAALSNRPTIDAGWGLVVAGRTGTSGTLREVTRIRMGRVMDTQRRRRRSLKEQYYTSVFSA